MKEVETLSEDLGFVVGFNPEALPGMQPSKALLKAGEDFTFRWQVLNLCGGDFLQD